MEPVPVQDKKLHPLILKRRSLRAYDPTKEVSAEDLNSLFEAARWSPSAFNEQPWRFIYARKGTDAYQKLFDCILPANQVWAINAPVLIMTIVKLNSSHNDQHNRHAMHDLGLAMGMLSMQATHVGLNLHQMGGFMQRQAEDIFQIPQGFEAVTITSAGFTGPTDVLSEILLQRELAPRVRKDISEFAFQNEWKQ